MDEDAKYAWWLQQQEIESIAAEDAKMAAALQLVGCEGCATSDYETQAIALSLQDQQRCDDEPMSITFSEPEYMRPSTIDQFDGTDSEVDRLSRNMADAVLQEEVAMATRSDEMLARNLHQEETQHHSIDQEADLRIACCLHQEEVTTVTQNDGLLAQELQTIAQPEAAAETAAAEALQRQELEEAARRDEAFARQLQDREKAYTQQALWELGEQIGDAQPQGLHDNQINAMPTQTHRAAPTPTPTSSNHGDTTSAPPPDSKDTAQCKVCLSEFGDGDTLRTLPCLHKYHQECIDRWIKTSAKCPICMLPLKEELAKVGIS